jgi:hypothetical protein
MISALLGSSDFGVWNERRCIAGNVAWQPPSGKSELPMAAIRFAARYWRATA